MRVALVHDYLIVYGGAERVLEALHEIWPEAPVYTAYYNPTALGPHASRFKTWDIRTSWMQKIPFANKLISPFRIFAPMMFESFDLSGYDLVISSSSAIYFAKSVITKPETLHLSYIHTPPRFLYGFTTSFNYKKHWWTRVGGELINHVLRVYDFETSQRPDILVANSKNVRERIKKFYRREAVVIYPPVELRKGERGKGKGERKYFLTVGRLVRGKGVEVIVEACAKLGLPLKVVGDGPEMNNLTSYFSYPTSKIEFLGEVKDKKLPALYVGAKATIVASEDEDFGIVPVESMAYGTPVIAPAAAGFLETVIDGKTGILYEVDRGQVFDSEVAQTRGVTVDRLVEGIKRFNDLNHWNKKELVKQAEKFSKERFKKEILELVKKNLDKVR